LIWHIDRIGWDLAVFFLPKYFPNFLPKCFPKENNQIGIPTVDQVLRSSLFEYIQMNLAYRTTSHGGDEAICLAVLLKRTDLLQDILAVSSGPDTRYLRYTVLLDALKDVPRSFLFKDVARVSEDGLRWAPRSFLGDYKPVEFLAYTENNELDTRTCKVHSEGRAKSIAKDFAPLAQEYFLLDVGAQGRQERGRRLLY